MVKVSHIVNSVFTSKTYVLTQEESLSVWLVDCGDVPPIGDLLSSLGGNSFIIKGVLLTHVHYDHIYGLPKLKEMFPSLRVYTNEYGKKALADIRLNYSKYHNDPIAYDSENVVTTLKGGDKQKAAESVERILRLAEGKMVCPGHDAL